MKIDAKKKITVDKIQYPFIIETVSKLGIEGNFLNWIKVIYKKKKKRKNLKCNLQSGRSRSEKVTYCMILTI